MDLSNEVKEEKKNYTDTSLQYAESILLKKAEKTHLEPTDKKYHVYFGRTYMKSFLTEKEAKEYIDSMPNICTVMIYHPKGP